MKKLRMIMYKIMIRLGIPLFTKKEMKVIRGALEDIEKEEKKDVAN